VRMMTVMMTVLVVSVIMMMVSGFLPFAPFITTDKKAPTRNAVPFAALEAARREVDIQRLQSLLKNLLRDPEIPQGGHGHVAADSGKGIDMKEFHEYWFLAGGRKGPSIHSHLLSADTAMQKN